MDIELLIYEVEKRPVLWNTSSEEYKDRNKKNEGWLSVASCLFEDFDTKNDSEKTLIGNELKKRWKNLRTCFKREYNIQRNMTAASATKRRHKYMYFDQLLFLLPFMEDRDPICNLQSPSGSNNDTETKSDNAESDVEVIDVNWTPTYELSLPKRRKITNLPKEKQQDNSYEDQVLQLLQAKMEADNNVDEDKYFLLSLLPTFKKLNDDQKFLAKIEIMQTMRRVCLSSASNYQLTESPSGSEMKISIPEVVTSMNSS